MQHTVGNITIKKLHISSVLPAHSIQCVGNLPQGTILLRHRHLRATGVPGGGGLKRMRGLRQRPGPSQIIHQRRVRGTNFGSVAKAQQVGRVKRDHTLGLIG